MRVEITKDCKLDGQSFTKGEVVEVTTAQMKKLARRGAVRLGSRRAPTETK